MNSINEERTDRVTCLFKETNVFGGGSAFDLSVNMIRVEVSGGTCGPSTVKAIEFGVASILGADRYHPHAGVPTMMCLGHYFSQTARMTRSVSNTSFDFYYNSHGRVAGAFEVGVDGAFTTNSSCTEAETEFRKGCSTEDGAKGEKGNLNIFDLNAGKKVALFHDGGCGWINLTQHHHRMFRTADANFKVEPSFLYTGRRGWIVTNRILDDLTTNPGPGVVFASSYYRGQDNSEDAGPFDYCDGSSLLDEGDDVAVARISYQSDPVRNIPGYDPFSPGEYACAMESGAPSTKRNITDWTIFYANLVGRSYNFARFTDASIIAGYDDTSLVGGFDPRNHLLAAANANVNNKWRSQTHVPCYLGGETYCLDNCLPCDGQLEYKKSPCMNGVKMNVNSSDASRQQCKMPHYQMLSSKRLLALSHESSHKQVCDECVLAAVIDGTKSTWHYDSALWTDNNVFDDGREKKTLAWFTKTKFIRMTFRTADGKCVQELMYSPKSTSGAEISFSLQEIFGDIGRARLNRDSPGRDAWLKLGCGEYATQMHCNRHGFNIKAGEDRVRFGLIMNQEDDCDTPDTAIGIGISSRTGDLAAGGQYQCCSENDKKTTIPVLATISIGGAARGKAVQTENVKFGGPFGSAVRACANMTTFGDNFTGGSEYFLDLVPLSDQVNKTYPMTTNDDYDEVEDKPATSSLAASYYITELNENCEIASNVITSKEECAIALKAVGKSDRIMWNSVHQAIPGGCSVRGENEGHYDNRGIQKIVGEKRQDLRAVCKGTRKNSNSTNGNGRYYLYAYGDLAGKTQQNQCAGANEICVHGLGKNSANELCCGDSAGRSDYCGVTGIAEFQWTNMALVFPNCTNLSYLRIRDGYELEVATLADPSKGISSASTITRHRGFVDLYADGETLRTIHMMRLLSSPRTEWEERHRNVNQFRMELSTVTGSSWQKGRTIASGNSIEVIKTLHYTLTTSRDKCSYACYANLECVGATFAVVARSRTCVLHKRRHTWNKIAVISMEPAASGDSAMTVERSDRRSVSFGVPYDCERSFDRQLRDDAFDCVRKYFGTYDASSPLTKLSNDRGGCGWSNLTQWNHEIEGNPQTSPSWLYTDRFGWILSTERLDMASPINGSNVFASSWGDPLSSSSSQVDVDYEDGQRPNRIQKVTNAVWSYRAKYVNCEV